MARQKGIVRVEGTLGDLSFYSSVFGDIVRRKGGASKEKILKSPAFKNLRKHHKEFTDCANAGKLLRKVWLPYSRQAADHTLVWRVTQAMHKVKDCDVVSEWGQRSVKKGLENKEGKNILKGFELNSKAALKAKLNAKLVIKDAKFYFEGLSPKLHLSFPEGATHVCVRGIVSVVDFENNKHQIFTDEVELDKKHKKEDVVLAPNTGNAKGFIFYLVQLRFLQKLNGGSYELKEGNSLGIVEVEEV